MNNPESSKSQDNPLSPEPKLFHLVVKGGVWVFFLKVTQYLLTTVRLIVLWRLLQVEDFGLIGIALLAMATIETFTKTGFQDALIQKKEDIRSYLDSAWTVGLIRGTILFLLLYFIAPYAAAIKTPPDKIGIATGMIQLVSFSFLLQGLSNIGIIYLQKELDFRKQYVLQIFATLADVIVSVAIALMYKSAWALAWGLLAGNIVRCGFSYAIHPYRPRFKVDWGLARSLFSYGRWIFASTILVFLLSQGNDYFAWVYLGITALGYYQTAYKISNSPATEITNVISQVIFPAYAKMQDDIPRLRDAYLKVLQLITFLSFPLAGLIFIMAPDFITLFFKEKGLPLIALVQILAFKGLMRSFGATTGPLFQAIGKPQINTIIQVGLLILLVLFIYPFSKTWGINGTAWAVVISSLLTQPFSIYLTIKNLHCRTWHILKVLFYPFAGTLGSIMAVGAMKYFIFTQPTYVSFFLLSLLGILIYIIMILFCDRVFGYGMKKIMQEQLATICSR